MLGVNSMTSPIRNLLQTDPLAVRDSELRHRDGLHGFSEYLPLDADENWARALSVFVRSRPWRYWDENTLSEALTVLEHSVERTAEAITEWGRQISTGFDSLFKMSAAADYEEALDVNKPRDLLRLATEFHPDYLRSAEHSFSNLLTIYWAVLKKGSVTGKFDLRGAVALVNRKHALLTDGYDDQVRNAIAHGETVFRGEGVIQYGPNIANYSLAPFEFLSRYDQLWRTSNGLLIAVLLFLARNEKNLLSRSNFRLPVSIAVFLAAAGIERPGLAVIAHIESDTPRGGKRLHLFLQSNFRWRVQVLSDCARLSMYLLNHGASHYSRYVFDVNHGHSVSSLVMIKPDRLDELIRTEAPLPQLSEAFDENLLLWYDESRFRHILKAWRAMLTSHYQIFREDFQRQMTTAGFLQGSNDYHIRKIENASVGGVRRVRVTAVLRQPADANDRGRMRQIIRSIVKRMSSVKVRTNPSGLENHWSVSGSPSYIWISLHKVDGSLRWLSNGGWQSGNLVAVAEKLRKRKLDPVFVPNPEEVWHDIRLRYAIDIDAYAEAMNNLARVMDQVR